MPEFLIDLIILSPRIGVFVFLMTASIILAVVAWINIRNELM